MSALRVTRFPPPQRRTGFSGLPRNRRPEVAFDARLRQNPRMKSKVNGKNARPVELGHFIVADPKVCHGKPTFKGTRVMVFQVLEQVAYGSPWERIVWSWRGKVPMEAITEAVRLASALFQEERAFHKAHANHRRKYLRNRSLAFA